MPLPKKHNERFSTIYLHIANDDDVPDIAKELVGAIRFVEAKVSRREYYRLIGLIRALGGPMYFPLYPTMVGHIIAGYERVLTFEISQVFRFSLNKDLALLRLFYQGLEQYMPCDEVSKIDYALVNPLKGKFKDYRAAACFAQNWAMDKNEDEVRLICTEFIEFCLFQFQLLSGWLTEESACAVRKMKGDSTFWNRLYHRLDTTLTGKKLLDAFLIQYDRVSQGYQGDRADEGVVKKCRELVDRFFEPADPEPKLDDSALNEQMLNESLLWGRDRRFGEPDELTEHSFISGNQLTLDEKLHLPMRRNVMMPHEISALLRVIKQSGRNDVDLAFLITSLVTSKPLYYLAHLSIARVPLHFSMGDYIDVSRGIWLRRPVRTPAAFEPTPQQQNFLHPHQGHVELPLPVLLVKTLDKVMKKKKLVVTNFVRLRADMFSWRSSYENEVLLSLHRPITAAMIRSTMFMHLAKLTDPNYAALILANTEYVQFTHLYYLSRSHNDVINTYTKALAMWGLDCDLSLDLAERHQNEFYTGSQMAVRIEALAVGINEIVNSVKARMKLCERGEVDSLILAHNTFAVYTVFMLICASTHRPRTEFNFTDFTCADDLCLLADKVNFDDSKIRINPLPAMVVKQVESYRNHSRRIAKLLPPTFGDIKALLFDISRNRPCGVAHFGMINQKHQWQPIGKAEVEAVVSPVVPLPLNIFRHHLATKLRDHDLGDYAQQLMGHIGTGEHPLSAYSPCKIGDVLKLTYAIEGILAESGFSVIHCDKPRGTLPKSKLRFNIYQGSLEIPTREKHQPLVQWAAQHVQSNQNDMLKHNLERPLQKHELIDRAIAKFESKADQKLIAKFVGRFADRVLRPATRATWNDLTFEELELGVDTIHHQKQAELVCCFAHEYVKGKDKVLLPFNFVLSLIVNGGLNREISPAMLAAVKQAPIRQNNLYWFSWQEEGQQQRILLDSISLCIRLQPGAVDNLTCHQLSRHYELFRLKLARLDGMDASVVERLVDLSALANFLAVCFDRHIPASLRYYRAGMIETTCLTDRSMARFVSGMPFYQVRAADDEQEHLSVRALKYDGRCGSIASSLLLIKKIARTLSDQNKNQTAKSNKDFVRNTILSEWQQATECETTELSELVRKSDDIAPTTVGVLVWLLDVANKPGRGRDHKAIGTITTYLSNVAKPLLEEDVDFGFFGFDDEELEDLYLRTLEARAIEKRGERAALLRRFHRHMMRTFYLPEVDWYEIEPTIDAKDHKVNANIISMADYERALQLLKTDKHCSKSERALNMVCLILCYRLGLRSGEVRGLELKDIDTEDWIIHVRSNRHGRKKSLRSNRRIPAALLLSEGEKQCIVDYVNRLNCIHFITARVTVSKGLSLCSSDVYGTTLINFANVVSRVIEALRLATKDETLRLHHGRHSSATFLKLIIEFDGQGGILAKQLKAWARTQDLTGFAKAIRQTLTGFEDITHRCMPALTALIGHVKVATTAMHYIHCYDLQLLNYNEQRLQQHYTTKFIADMLNIDDAYARQTIKRSSLETGKFNHLITKAMEKGQGYELQSLPADLELSTVTEFTTKQPGNELFDKLSKIHLVLQFFHIHEKTEYIYELFNIRGGFSTKALAAAKKLAEQTKYTDYTIPPNSDAQFRRQFVNFKVKPMTTQNYFSSKPFRILVARVAQLIDQGKYTLEEIHDTWQNHYHAKYELTIRFDERANGRLQRLAESLGLIFTAETLTDRDNAELGVYADKRVKLKWQKDSRNSFNGKFNYLMFLCGVWLGMAKPVSEEQDKVKEVRNIGGITFTR